MTVVLSCLTLIYICKKEVRHWIIKTGLVFLSQQLLWPTTIAISCDQFSFLKQGQSSNLSPLNLIFISKGLALRLVLRQKLETTRKWPIRITLYLTYYLTNNEWGWVSYEELWRRPRRITPSEVSKIFIWYESWIQELFYYSFKIIPSLKTKLKHAYFHRC